MKYQRGYTLIELMISLLLGLVLISGFGSLFIQTQKNYTVQRSLSYLMEDGRYILEVLSRELRRTSSLKSPLDAYGRANLVFTDDADVLGSTMSFSAGDYIRGEYNAAGFGAAADQPYNVNRLTIRYQLNDDTELSANDPSSDNSPCTRSIHLNNGEDPATQVHVVTLYFYVAVDSTDVPVLYCVAKRQQINTVATPVTVVSTTTSSAEPLISNVQQLLVTYGIDTDADNAANYYVSATDVTNWQQVVAVKLSVVLRSEDDNLTTSPVNYSLDSTTYTPTDKRLYRVFSTTIAFRNKVL